MGSRGEEGLGPGLRVCVSGCLWGEAVIPGAGPEPHDLVPTGSVACRVWAASEVTLRLRT